MEFKVKKIDPNKVDKYGNVILTIEPIGLNKWQMLYDANVDIAGFQFNIEGASLISASGGEAEAAGFTTPTGNNIVLGFSLEGNTITGCGTMVILELEGKVGGLSNLVISNPKGEAIPFLIYF